VTVRELDSAPSLTTLYPKAVAGTGLSALKRLPGLKRDGGSPELPDDELVLREIEIDLEHLAAYDTVCTFEVRHVLPPTYPHLIAFPLSMELMTDGSFPFPVIGMVHIENRIEQLRPIRDDERLDMRVRTDNLAAHDRGTQFQVVAEASTGGEPVWRSVSTYLHKEGGGSKDGKGHDREQPPEPSATFAVPGHIGRRYAGVSGDRNPIHLHPVTSRLFGMARPIAHGMWLKARTLAVLESRLPDAHAVDVSFKLPVQLPARVALSAWDEGGELHLAVTDAKSGKPHLTGTIEPLTPP
jgi:hypothetical protein